MHGGVQPRQETALVWRLNGSLKSEKMRLHKRLAYAILLPCKATIWRHEMTAAGTVVLSLAADAVQLTRYVAMPGA